MQLLIAIIAIIVLIGITLAGVFYVFQEKFIFLPQKLEQNYKFSFNQNFEELSIKTTDGKLLNALLFKAENTQGLIFYLHGNAGSLESWGDVAQYYTHLNYDVFILDYRGYGKSEGNISDEKQLYADSQIAYNKMKQAYKEESIVVLGYSIGTGMAAKIAADNNPKLLILQAPFYSLKDMMNNQFYVSSFALRYHFRTDKFLEQCQCPIVIFHGDKDRIINYKSSVRLKEKFGNKIELIILSGEEHNTITDNEIYQKELLRILANGFIE